MRATDLLSEAWDRFKKGDASAALQLARQAISIGETPQAAAALGFFLLGTGQLDEAHDVLLPALTRTPRYAPLHWYVGLLYQQRGDTVMAADALRRACLLDESLDEAAFALAWLLHGLGQLPEALAWSQRALQTARLPQRVLQLGWLQQQLGNMRDAALLYEEAIAAFPHDASEQRRLHLHLAQCQVALQQTDQAGKTLYEGLARVPDDAELTTQLALHEWDQGRTEQAIALARAQTQAHPEQPDAWYLLGVLQHRAGDLRAADKSYNEVQQRDMENAGALLRRAQIQVGWGETEAALWLLQQVRQQPSQSAPVQALIVQVLLDLKQTQEARRHVLLLLRATPTDSDLWRLLAVAHLQRGKHRLARRALTRALQQDASNTEALRTLGWVAREQGDLATAQDAVRRLLTQTPNDAGAKIQAAFVFAAANHLADASRFAQAAVAHAPQNAEAWRALCDVRYRQGRLSEAEAAIETALHLQPDNIHSLRQLGWVMLANKRLGQAQLAFLRVQALAPDDPIPLLELAEVRLRGGEFTRGLEAVDELLRQHPAHSAALLMKARLLTEGSCQLPNGQERALSVCHRLLSDRQRIEETAKVLVRLVGLGTVGARAVLDLLSPRARQTALRDALADATARHGHTYLGRLAGVAVQEFPLDPWIATAALYNASLSDTSTPPYLALAARDWYRTLKLRVGLSKLNPPTQPFRQGARLRIAYIAGQLHQSLLRRVLANHDPEQAEVFVFSNRPLPLLPPHIHSEPLVLETLATSCAALQIDAVIDAGGLHPFEGQLGLLEAYARRLAPLQAGWLGCWGTAGGLFDVLLTDAQAVPVTHDAHYEEALWRIDGGQWCWDPPVHAPDTLNPPALHNGFVTFGVTARGLRLNQTSLETWAQVVMATPRSEIRFIGEVAGDWPQRAQILEVLRSNGVADARVAFDPPRNYEGLLQWFQQVDLVLDSFPSNGGLSLLDPLWMGVPVVSRSGDWAGARQALSILTALGLKEWAADTNAAYVQIATRLASNIEALRHHRTTLRSRMVNSPLVDGRRVAAQIERACRNFLDHLSKVTLSTDPKDHFRAWARRALHVWLDKPAHLDFPEIPGSATPDLSVVVVLYNQAGLTHKTLQALADQRGITFETIIVNNASSDETFSLLERVRGARIVSNAQNLGFLLAANQAATLARGRHLVLLNSDAVLQQGALAAACTRLDAEPAIGALGGRIVLTRGGLQEAGNRIFRDGRTVGIGRDDNPFCPAAMASRATDYVSGVLLAVPMPIWRMLGGFDETFAPAYYEDTDFCLRVWQAGFRVVYEPAVLVEHLEWGSATGDEAPGQMRSNQKLFLARHSAWLKNQPLATPQRLDGDRWCSPEDYPRRPRVLIIDNEVPHMVRGGGLPRARLMLQSLRDWPVTFFPLWLAEDDWRDVYASVPPSTEVMLGYGMGRLESFLEQRRGLYDVLVVSRPPNLEALLPLRQRRPELFAKMRLVYDAEALFALREIAEAAVKGLPLSRHAAQAKLAAEIALARGADQVLVVSERDASCFRAAGHQVTILSHAISARRSAPGAQHRSGLLFVGTLHPDTPNEDGLIWFIEHVMPLLRTLLPQPPVLSVVGINRSHRVSALASEDVHVLGPKENLEPLYDSARVFVAPVRFAGGVPAKVIEAAAHGLPVVASAVLVRQLGWDDGIDIQSARNAEAFARGIARLLHDDGLWQSQQHAAWQQCNTRYAPERFGHALQTVLNAQTRESR
ncbi:glycosyl transferase [Rhodoferax saidenbachensis]|uniref:protein O-GlcNAc transferase n=1 Tax=Rhodoferax saidenbachensis TaxID=1484693 RepID=A0A1P8KG57_9BURK|nr:glycosyl transferase [Rhodoferax saidenbachensis]